MVSLLSTTGFPLGTLWVQEDLSNHGATNTRAVSTDSIPRVQNPYAIAAPTSFRRPKWPIHSQPGERLLLDLHASETDLQDTTAIRLCHTHFERRDLYLIAHGRQIPCQMSDIPSHGAHVFAL